MTADSIAERARPTEPIAPPPLTRNGYTRTARAERDIVDLRTLHAGELANAFRLPDDPAGGGRSTEALVHFVRREALGGDRRTAEALFALLVERVGRQLRGAIRGVDEDGRADIQGEVLADMARLILAEDDSGDFLQSRFWLYLRRRTATARADWLRARARLLLADDLPRDESGAEPLVADGIASGDLSPEDSAILADALGRLPPELRELVVLRHYEGWRLGDEASERRADGDPTLAERYGITPRAVRKRLARAEAILNQNPRDRT